MKLNSHCESPDQTHPFPPFVLSKRWVTHSWLLVGKGGKEEEEEEEGGGGGKRVDGNQFIRTSRG